MKIWLEQPNYKQATCIWHHCDVQLGRLLGFQICLSLKWKGRYDCCLSFTKCVENTRVDNFQRFRDESSSIALRFFVKWKTKKTTVSADVSIWRMNESDLSIRSMRNRWVMKAFIGTADRSDLHHVAHQSCFISSSTNWVVNEWDGELFVASSPSTRCFYVEFRPVSWWRQDMEMCSRHWPFVMWG